MTARWKVPERACEKRQANAGSHRTGLVPSLPRVYSFQAACRTVAAQPGGCACENRTGLSETPNPVRSKGMKLPDGLTLRELEALTSLGLSGLLAFFLAGITGEEVVFAKGIAEVRVGFQEGAGDA